jgi:hypothetical protein
MLSIFGNGILKRAININYWNDRVFTSLIITFVLLTTSLIVFYSNEKSGVVGDEALLGDDAGYTWIDSKDPEPKIDYEWMDITDIGTPSKTNFPQSSTYRYLYYAMDYQDLGFDFPFYGKTYDKIQVYPNGVLGLGDSDYGYAIYNYQGPLPNTYVYVPKGCIAPLWLMYGAPLVNDDDSDVWLYKGQTDEGMKYWVASYADINYYSYSDEGATFQVILYENGDIVVNIKDFGSGLNTNCINYVTIGICNAERDIGLTYNYQNFYSLKEEMSVMFKQYKSTITDVKTVEGFGEENNIYPAMGGQGEFDYWTRAYLWCEKGVESLTRLDMILYTGSVTDGITLSYNFGSGEFRKLGDGAREMYFDERSCSIFYPNATDMFHYIGVEFRYDFNLWWGSTDPVNLYLILNGKGVKGTDLTVERAFTVETRVRMIGNLTITDSKGRSVTRGDWVKGGDTLHFSGITREYLNVGDAVQPPDYMRIALEDQNAKTYKGSTADLDIYVYVDPKFPTMVYHLVLENVSANNDVTEVELTADINIRVDSDKPGLPGDLRIYPDDPDQPPEDYDDDPEVYLKWADAVDPSSGVVSYHISVNRPKATATETFEVPKGTLSYRLSDLPEGSNNVYVWAEDAVGNLGGELFTTVKIDLTEVSFADFYPKSGLWLNNIRPTCSIWVNDTLTGVDPLSLEYEISTTGEIGLVGNWRQVQETYTPDNSLRVVVVGWFRNGQENWIKFRAKDIAGNGYAESEKYNVWIDSESPRYKLQSPTEGFQPSPTVDVKVWIEDKESGVDVSTIEYRYSTRGSGQFTPWMPYKDENAVDANSVLVTIRETFKRGDQNYVQVRARDLSSNPLIPSPSYQVKVNTVPTIVVVSPTQADRIEVGDKIIFDATPTYDYDGYTPTIVWYRSTPDGMESFGEGAYVEAMASMTEDAGFPPGQHTITVVARDELLNRAEYSFTIDVEKSGGGLDPWKIDTDGDGMVDGWEIQFQLDPTRKNAEEDPDGDGFWNIQEYENDTNPLFPWSHPLKTAEVEKPQYGNIFDNWLLWVILVVLLVAILATMFVAKTRKDKAVDRIRTVHNMRRIMPSVSWEQIQTTAYMAPAAQGMNLPGYAEARGPALPQAQAQVSPESALPPAQEAEAQMRQPAAHEATHVVQQGSYQQQPYGQDQQPQYPEQAYQAAPAAQNPETNSGEYYDPNATQD